MRLLQIVSTLHPDAGGVAEGVLQQSRELARQGFDVDIISLDRPGAGWGKDSAPGAVIELGSPRLAPFLPARLWRYRVTDRLVPWFRAHAAQYDAAIVNGLWDFTAHGSRLALRNAGLPYFVFPHGMLDPWFRQRYPLKHMLKQASWLAFEGPLLAGARGVLFTTADECAAARNVFRPYRIRENVVGYGIADLEDAPARQKAAFDAAFPALAGRPFLLFLSRIHPKKGCDDLFQAYAALPPDMRRFDLVMAGPDGVGWRGELEALAAALGIADRVHWTGMITGDVKLGALRACDAFILPSHQENFGVAVVEAMACARPVLISDKVNIHREVTQAGAGFVAGDDVAGADVLLRHFAQSTPDERRAMGEAARRCYVENFEIAQVTGRVAQLIRDAAPSRAR